SAQHDGYWARNSLTPSPILVGDIGPDETKRVDVALVRQCTGSLSGVVVFGDTQQPAAGASVYANDPTHAEFVKYTADAQGTFTIPEAPLGYNNGPGSYEFLAIGNTDYLYGGAFATLPECGAHAQVTIELPP